MYSGNELTNKKTKVVVRNSRKHKFLIFVWFFYRELLILKRFSFNTQKKDPFYYHNVNIKAIQF